MNPRHLPLIAFLALALGLWATMEYKPQPTVPVASTMPPLVIQRLNADAPIEWRATPGNVTLVNFFASWCVPCLVEHPQLKTLAKIDGIDVVGIAWNDKPAALNAWLDKHGNPFDSVWMDATGRAAIAAGLRGVPESFVVDKGGVVRLHIRGTIDANRIDELTRLLEELRDAKP